MFKDLHLMGWEVEGREVEGRRDEGEGLGFDQGAEG